MEKPKLYLPLPPKQDKPKKPPVRIPESEMRLYMDWLRRAKLAKNPNHDFRYFPLRKPKPKTPAGFIEDGIAQWCKAMGVPCTKIDVRGTYRNGRYMPTKSTKGVEDLQLIIGGRMVAVEVKAGGDRLSADQEARRDMLLSQSIAYHVAKSLEGFAVLMKQEYNLELI